MMDKLLELKACALITTGRTGTDFLQSLLDGHPEVLTFNGGLFFHDFWKESICVKAGKFAIEDFIDEFVGKYIEKFKSRYDLQERKNELGEDGRQSIDIDLGRFKAEAANFLKQTPLNSKTVMLAIYAAYAICLGEDIQKKKLLFHHIHHFERLDKYLQDFSESKIISMTRDPRANFVSGIENWRRYNPAADHGLHLYRYIRRILVDTSALSKYSNEYIAIKIEDLGKESALRKLAQWLNISYDQCMKKSTWAGLRWRGDRLSVNKNESGGWSETILRNKWDAKLGVIDKYILNYIMFYRLKYYGYSFKKINFIDSVVVLFLILFPLSYERRFFSWQYILGCLRKREYRKILRNIKAYPLRIILFFKYYAKTLRKDRSIYPFLIFD